MIILCYETVKIILSLNVPTNVYVRAQLRHTFDIIYLHTQVDYFNG